MICDLIVCTDDNRVINKNVSNVLKSNVNCEVYGSCSIYQPSLLLKYMQPSRQCNYVYVPEWDRYYWVVNYQLQSGDRMVLNLRCDVLMSFKPYIEKINCYIDKRNSKTGNATNMYLPDGNIPVSSDTFIGNIPFSENPFDINPSQSRNGWFVLTVLGG